MERMSYPKTIRTFLEDVVSEIVTTLDPEIILLAGSFGKKSWLFSNENLLSDFEIVFICDKAWSRSKKKKLLKRLNSKFPYEISLKGFLKNKILNKSISNYSNRNPGYLSLDFFDAFSSQSIIYSKNKEDIQIDCSPAEIPVWEAWRLYVNRIGDLLQLDLLENADDSTIRYFWLKILESTADAFLIINGTYASDINIRVANFYTQTQKNDQNLSSICKNSYSIILKSLEARQKHDLSFFDIDINEDKLNNIVLSWLDYFQIKLNIEEDLEGVGKNDFFLNYLNSKEINSRYLGFVSNGKIKSNLIRLISNFRLFKLPFKFYNMKYSWRHIILLTIASIYFESGIKKNNLIRSRSIAQNVLRQNMGSMEKKEFIMVVLKYWKILR